MLGTVPIEMLTGLAIFIISHRSVQRLGGSKGTHKKLSHGQTDAGHGFSVSERGRGGRNRHGLFFSKGGITSWSSI
jgi:hypothetical protein